MKRKRNQNPLMAQYEDIMKNFDFDRVVEFMNWNKSYRVYDDDGKCCGKTEWAMFCGGKFAVPSEAELRRLAESLLKETIQEYERKKSDFTYVASGPFKAICRYGILELDCVIEWWSND